MKSYATFFIIAVMTLSLLSMVVTRDRTKHDAPAEVVEVTDAASRDGGVEGGAADAAVLAVVDSAAKAAPERPLRVVALGWELAAAGAAITPGDGGALPPPSPPIELAPETALDALEARLARGGGDPQGADIAILPLPAFVMSFEKLRALEPRAFLVIGFSHGREEIHATPGALLKAPPASDEVKVVADTASSESATFLGLFALDLLGVAPSRVRFLAPGTPEAKAASIAAIVKGTADERKLAFSTADAARLVPIVAVAPKGVLETREPALREWSKVWLDGLSRVSKDVPSIARRLAAKEALAFAGGVGGAPEALSLVERLGQIENATLEQQTSFIGALAKGAVTLDTLTQRTWQLARGGGLTTNAAPDPLPMDARVVSMIAPPPKATPPALASDADGGITLGTLPTGAVPLVAYRETAGDADRVATQLLFLSVVFDRALFRITAKGGEKAARAIALAARDKGVPSARLAVADTDPGIVASVEILAPP